MITSELKKELNYLIFNAENKARVESIYLFTLTTLEVLMNYFQTFDEYAISEIKKKGLKEILLKRAYRFFGLKNDKTRSRSGKKSKVSFKVNKRQTKKRILTLIFSPFYLVILVLLLITRRKNPKKVNRYKL